MFFLSICLVKGFLMLGVTPSPPEVLKTRKSQDSRVFLFVALRLKASQNSNYINCLGQTSFFDRLVRSHPVLMKLKVRCENT
jgi:hypothetical protein